MSQTEVKAQVKLNIQTENKLKTLFSGLVAGLSSRTFVAPFERTIIIKQTGVGEYNGSSSMFSLLGSIFKKEGFFGFFRGNAANCFRVAPSTAIEFFVFDQFKLLLSNLPFLKLDDRTRYLLSGSLAGVAAYSIVYPIDVVKTMHSLGLYKEHSVMRTMQLLIAKNGWKIYRGLAATCCGIFPYAGLKLGSYQMLTNLYYKGEHTKRSNNQMNLILGGLAGYIAVTISYPTDFIRRNHQVSILKGAQTVTYGSIIRDTWKSGGIRGFYRGLVPTYWKIIPSTGIAFLVNEFMKEKILH